MTKSLGLFFDNTLNGVIELTNEQYDIYRLNKEKLNLFEQDQQLYRILERNYDDIFIMLDHYLDEHMNEPSMNWIKMNSIMLDINRYLLNFLTSLRAYLDHSESRLKKKFGKNSKELTEYKTACSYEYDNNFSYRFFYKLRNYAQHCGMPAGNFSIGSKLNDKKEVDYFIVVQFDRNTLLNNYDSWGARVKAEISELPQLFEVNKHLYDVKKSIEQINHKLFEIRLPEIIEGAQYINELMNMLPKDNGLPCIIDMNKMTDQGGKIDIEWIPFHLVDMVMQLD